MGMGLVSLVGAGPGDPDLITVKGLRRIVSCDALVYDHLVSEELLECVRKGCELIYVGKEPGKHSCSQEVIHEILVRLAVDGKTVVRLKGGDPFIFGRGGEEVAQLQENGIPVEVIPAVTSALGAAAYSGTPLTYRNVAKSVAFITGHECEASDQSIQWEMYGQLNMTLCLYMGVKHIAGISERLIKGGMHPETPFLIVEKATTNQQRCIEGILSEIGQRVESEKVSNPAMIMIGEVVKHRKDWKDDVVDKWMQYPKFSSIFG